MFVLDSNRLFVAKSYTIISIFSSTQLHSDCSRSRVRLSNCCLIIHSMVAMCCYINLLVTEFKYIIPNYNICNYFALSYLLQQLMRLSNDCTVNTTGKDLGFFYVQSF